MDYVIYVVNYLCKERDIGTLDSIRKLRDLLYRTDHVTIKKSIINETRMGATMFLYRYVTEDRRYENLESKIKHRIDRSVRDSLIKTDPVDVEKIIQDVLIALTRYDVITKGEPIKAAIDQITLYCRCNINSRLAIGSWAYCSIASLAPLTCSQYVETFFKTFIYVLTHTGVKSSDVEYSYINIIAGMANLMFCADGVNDLEESMTNIMPRILCIAHVLAERECDYQFLRVFDFIWAVCVYNPRLLNIHLPLVLDLCITVANNESVTKIARGTCMGCLMWLMHNKMQITRSPDLMERMLRRLLSYNPLNKIQHIILQIVSDYAHENVLAVTFMNVVEPSFRSDNPQILCKALCQLMLISETCGDYIRFRYLEQVIGHVRAGLRSRSSKVRDTALMAVADFAKSMQPDIKVFAPAILPQLDDILNEKCREVIDGNELNYKSMLRLYNALVNFSINLKSHLTPYLPRITATYSFILESAPLSDIHEITLSALGNSIYVIKEEAVPFAPKLIGVIFKIISDTERTDSAKTLSSAFKCLAIILSALDTPTLEPVLHRLNPVAVRLFETKKEEYNLRCAILLTYASVAIVLREDFRQVFPAIMDHVLNADHYQQILDLEENPDETEQAESDDEDEACTAYTEVAETMYALARFASYTGNAFTPYLKRSYEYVQQFKYVRHYQVFERFSEACIAFSMAGVKANIPDFPEKSINSILLILYATARNFDDHKLAVIAINGVRSFLKKFAPYLRHKFRNAVVIVLHVVRDVLTGLTKSQKTIDEFCKKESIACHILIKLSRVFGTVNPELLEAFLEDLLPRLNHSLSLLEGSHKLHLRYLLSFTFVTVLPMISRILVNLAPHLFDVCAEGLDHDDAEICYSSFKILREIIPQVIEKRRVALPLLMRAILMAVKKNFSSACTDHICVVIAKLIQIDYNIVPLNHIFPVYITLLPLRIDFSGYFDIYKSFAVVYYYNKEIIKPYLDAIIHNSFCIDDYQGSDKEEFRQFVIQLLRKFGDENPELRSQMPAFVYEETVEDDETATN